MDASLVTVLPDLLLAISGLLNFRNSCLSLEKWKPQTKSLVRQATRKQPLTVVKCHRVCESRSRLQPEGEVRTTMVMQAGFSLYFVSNLMKCTVTVF